MLLPSDLWVQNASPYVKYATEILCSQMDGDPLQVVGFWQCQIIHFSIDICLITAWKMMRI